MHDFMALTKALWKAGFSISIRSKEGKKSLFVLGVLVLCMGPLLVSLYALFRQAFVMGLDTLMMEMAFACICFLMMWTALFAFPSVFYFSNDLVHLLALPVSSRQIVGAKFMIVYAGLLTVSVLGTIPLMVAYLQAGHMDIVTLLFFIPQLFLIGAPCAFVVSSFWILLFRLLPFFQDKDCFNLIAGLLSLVLCVGIGLFSGTIGASSEDPALILEALQTNPGSMIILIRLFANVSFAVRSILTHSVWDLLITVIITGACALLFVVVSDAFYLDSAKEARSSGKKKQKKIHYQKQGNVIFSYAKVEILRLVRTPAYVSNCILSSLVMPVLFIAMIFFMPDIDELKMILQQIDLPGMINLPLALFIGGAAIGFFTGSLNGISATAFSREGKNLPFIRYIPLDFKKQYRIKASIGILFSFLTCAMMLICIHLILTYPICYDFFYLSGSLLSCILVNVIAIFVDGMHPKTNWEDEMSAIKNNMNVVLEFVISWAILALIIAPLFLFRLETYWETYSCIMIGILVFITGFLCWFTPHVVYKHMTRQ